jgi:DNA-binding response OmpR family regulator
MRRQHILLAIFEEPPFTVHTIDLALKYWGFQVATAASPEPAEEALQEKPFDLVITNRLDVLKHSKEMNPETMVMILADTPNVSFAIRALRLHADDYMIESIDLLELLNRVTYHLRKRSGRGVRNSLFARKAQPLPRGNVVRGGL